MLSSQVQPLVKHCLNFVPIISILVFILSLVCPRIHYCLVLHAFKFQVTVTIMIVLLNNFYFSLDIKWEPFLLAHSSSASFHCHVILWSEFAVVTYNMFLLIDIQCSSLFVFLCYVLLLWTFLYMFPYTRAYAFPLGEMVMPEAIPIFIFSSDVQFLPMHLSLPLKQLVSLFLFLPGSDFLTHTKISPFHMLWPTCLFFLLLLFLAKPHPWLNSVIFLFFTLSWTYSLTQLYWGTHFTCVTTQPLSTLNATSLSNFISPVSSPPRQLSHSFLF